MTIEVSNTGIDLADEQVKSELDALQDSLKKSGNKPKPQQPKAPEKVKEIPQELKSYRQAWDKNIQIVDASTKDKIKEAANKLPLTAEKQSDGSMLIELTLGNKKYRILNPNLSCHTDTVYKTSTKYEITGKLKTEVKLGGMMGDDVNKRENQKLKSYVKQQQSKGLHIPSKGEMRLLINELGAIAGLIEEGDKIAMLMYLTGMEGWYWLSMGDNTMSLTQQVQEKIRSALVCGDGRFYSSSGHDNGKASLCMIARK